MGRYPNARFRIQNAMSPARPPNLRRSSPGGGRAGGTAAARIQAVTFDVGGTLIQPWPSVGHVYAEVAARNGLRGLSPALLNRRFARAWRALKNFNHRRSEWSALVDETFRGLANPPPGKTFFPQLYQCFAEPDAWRIFDDVRPALEQLHGRGIRLAVISNWDERLRPLLRRLGLAKFFCTVVVSCDLGHPKPSPLIFRAAARALQLPPQAILHVGDSFVMDVQGARAAGFRALLLNRGRTGGRKQSICRLTDVLAHLVTT
jgi:putative hydrolase of the HAD superfamily